MHEAFVPLGGFRRALVLRQALQQLCAELDRVDHLSLRRPRMDAQPFDPDAYLRGGKSLVVDAADLGPVQRVRELRAECIDVEMVDAATDFFVDGETDADRS